MEALIAWDWKKRQWPYLQFMNHQEVLYVPLIIGRVDDVVADALSQDAEARDKSGVMKASDLIGMKVEGTDGKNVGMILDLVIDPADASIDYAVWISGVSWESETSILPCHGTPSLGRTTARRSHWTSPRKT